MLPSNLYWLLGKTDRLTGNKLNNLPRTSLGWQCGEDRRQSCDRVRR